MENRGRREKVEDAKVIRACLCMYSCAGGKRSVRAMEKGRETNAGVHVHVRGIRVYYRKCDERDAYIRMIAMNGKVLSWTLLSCLDLAQRWRCSPNITYQKNVWFGLIS